VKRVGILAGSFDPVHNGHIAFAMAAIKECRLDKVFFLVEPRPRRKQGVKAFEHRVAMVKLATAGNPKLGSIVVNQARFSVHETLPRLISRLGNNIYMLMGDDVLAHLTNWPHVKELVEAVHIVIGTRQGNADKTRKLGNSINSIRGLNFNFTVIETDQPGSASSYVRLQLRRGHTPKALSKKVANYIHRHKLYSPNTS